MKKNKAKYEITGCIGCKICVTKYPKVFKLNNRGLAEVSNQKAQEEIVKEAKEQCLVGAIIINNLKKQEEDAN